MSTLRELTHAMETPAISLSYSIEAKKSYFSPEQPHEPCNLHTLKSLHDSGNLST